ncbi:putative membrane bound protein [Bacillus phage vB_BmeM-Goe8]|uniref:Putative membrane bound protein n=1 Tax=Bacillus phage vB_BmeM-Goe8 TaxID=2593638 RepID=A0A516KMU1_9CAUD|nr:putative membrane bound protein [Bacillus phage vB_BmeM-Goe8]QDP42904.1 putative membrane bound protein [Bacillus phage vB_BmeM-Goe8]
MTNIIKVACWYGFFYILLFVVWIIVSDWMFGEIYLSEDWTPVTVGAGAFFTALYLVGALDKRKRGKANGEK